LDLKSGRIGQGRVKKLFASLSCIGLLGMAGCAGAPQFATGAFTGKSSGLQGKAYGGNQPIAYATVTLYAAGTTGNGSTPTSLLTTPVSTDEYGNFDITNDYPCASPTEQVYLTVTGGEPSPGMTNSNLFLMAAIGNCSTLQSTAFVMVNELSTVAAVYALTPFMGAGGTVGASSTNAQGLANAFSTVGELENVSTGAVPGPGLPSGSILEIDKITALADALAPCINSDGTDMCSSLFSAATANGVTPASIPDALANIVRNPIANPTGIFNLIPPSAPFATTMSAVPNDWTLSVVYGNPVGACTLGICLPTAVAVDGNGNVWVANYNHGAAEFTALGGYTTTVTGGGMAESYGLAVDPSNTVWVTNQETRVNGVKGSVTTINANTAAITSSGSGLNPGGVIYYPEAVTASASGNIWVANYGNSSVAELTSSGTAVAGTPFGTGSLVFPVAVAVDGSGTAWVANQSASTISSVSADGATVASYTCCNGASGVAIDQNQNVWVTNYFGDSISEVSNTGTVLINGATGGGIYHPQGIAVDGVGNVWVANYRGNSLTELAGANASVPGTILTTSGLGADSVTNDSNHDASMNEPYSLAVDASGSVWVANYGSDSLVRFVGLAAPVKTPLAGPVEAP